MTKVYILTRGDYSDYTIYGAYDSELTATKAANFFFPDDPQSANIEVYDLNKFIDLYERGYRLFSIAIKKDGTIIDFEQEMPDWTSEYKTELIFYKVVVPIRDTLLRVNCWAKSKEAAIKIAGDERAKLIANNLWRNYEDFKPGDIKLVITYENK